MKKITGKVEGVYYTIENEKFSIPIDEVDFSFEGMQGDKHSSLTALSRTNHPEFKEKIVLKNTRQISIMSVEELSLIAEQIGIPEIKAEWLSTNLLVSGIPHLSKLPPGTRFYFTGGLILYNEGQNFPCKTTGNIISEKHPDKEGIGKEFIKAAVDKRGLVAWVEHPEKLKSGTPFEIELPPAWENLWN